MSQILVVVASSKLVLVPPSQKTSWWIIECSNGIDPVTCEKLLGGRGERTACETCIPVGNTDQRFPVARGPGVLSSPVFSVGLPEWDTYGIGRHNHVVSPWEERAL